MKYLSLLLIIFLCSCATLINTDLTTINIYTKQDSTKICVGNDTSNNSFSPARFHVYRSKYPLNISIIYDTIKKNILIPSKLSNAFLFGNLINGSLFYGYLIDLTSEKRFTYPSKILIDENNINDINLKYKDPENKPISENSVVPDDQKKQILGEKGMYFIKLSIPEGNCFHIKNKTEYEDYFGFLGITSEIGYYYSNTNYLSFGAGTLTDFMIPFPASISYSGVYETASGLYFDLNHGYHFNRIALSYGLNFSKNTYNHNYRPSYNQDSLPIDPNIDTLRYSVRENAIGLSLTAKYMVSDYFQIGLKYLPSITNIDNPGKANYSHFIFLDLIFNIEIRPDKSR